MSEEEIQKIQSMLAVLMRRILILEAKSTPSIHRSKPSDLQALNELIKEAAKAKFD